MCFVLRLRKVYGFFSNAAVGPRKLWTLIQFTRIMITINYNYRLGFNFYSPAPIIYIQMNKLSISHQKNNKNLVVANSFEYHDLHSTH